MKILVTGGGGFLGQALCRGLLKRGYQVLSFQRGYYHTLQALGVVQICGDLTDLHAVRHAVRGMDAVFHNAAKVGAWGSYTNYHQVNVVGTQHVLDACRAENIGKLVYTSSPSVIHRFTYPVGGLDADQVPYSKDVKVPYAATKAIAEQAVLAANGPDLSTVALRPRMIWGPGDQHLVPRLVARARAGRLCLIGDGSNLVDSTYIDNAAQAHFDVFDHLTPGAACAGKAYFISNGEPLPMRELINKLLAAVNAPQVTKSLSFKAGYRIGALCEMLWSLLPLPGEPLLTRFLVEQMSTPHWYSMVPAKRDFGYVPRVSIEEGLVRLLSDWG
ncbi:NAD-dependent epimerase/dehydratase family protein [Xylella taiwanensis]|uniref:3-beta hydroxysteroid dehydrogenase n=1 Tax=Xylella taiwanensis TaxID=1444770 RepID=Z9JIP7_9GAMM|nr:2-alkyl-3-oxoalkanoate reductase [Xylella taiwanensis]AXI83511.1 3-beta hydroxysteroid dehydrogenase [Xylella taiwanensis]EWS78014.1 3-beta hydroxysteroid dehydrogenase [Xylella taiwanensis]MCD8456586.1 NAD-dependent epimerase/dehydratase family protein [Xylella taiwanensis]MCD8458993.1 NAD-dependent epimerase/dehydratase family protein [Xylella taiwanensis]MCD8461132.1 NAD-dependent epimerase/dehydratase family protein [Xylella taiwanensis]